MYTTTGEKIFLVLFGAFLVAMIALIFMDGADIEDIKGGHVDTVFYDVLDVSEDVDEFFVLIPVTTYVNNGRTMTPVTNYVPSYTEYKQLHVTVRDGKGSRKITLNNFEVVKNSGNTTTLVIKKVDDYKDDAITGVLYVPE